MNNTPKITRKYKYAKLRYEVELENITHIHNKKRKKYRNIQLSLAISIISILMSICLMAGTTYAWFTSTISNSGNVIKSGYIDVELYAQHNNGTIVNLTDSNSPAFNVSELSPDNNEIETKFTVANVGTLPFKCYMCFLNISDYDVTNGLSSSLMISIQGDDGSFSQPRPMRTLIDENNCIFSIDNIAMSESKDVVVKISLSDETSPNEDITFDICLYAKQIN